MVTLDDGVDTQFQGSKSRFTLSADLDQSEGCIYVM